MTIATYNLSFLFDEGTHVRSGKSWIYPAELVTARIDHFARQFSQIGADAWLLQEVASERVLQQIIERSGIDYQYFLATPDENGIGNAVVYRSSDAVATSIPPVAPLPVFRVGDSDTLGPRIQARRDCIHLQTRWQGRPLHLVNLHLKSNFLMAEYDQAGAAQPMTTQGAAADGVIRSEFFRLAQAKRVRQLIDDIFTTDPEAAVVVGGDLNATEESGVFRIIRGALKKASDALVPMSHAVPLDQRFSHVYHGGTQILIDHLLVSKPLNSSVATVRILIDSLVEDSQVAPTPTMVGSDHAPVVLELADAR